MRRFVLVSLVVWGLLGLAAAGVAPRLPGALRAAVSTPPDSDSAKAAALLAREFTSLPVVEAGRSGGDAIAAAPRSEKFVIPAVLAVLLLSCGSLVAGLVPLVLGLVSAGVTLAVFYVYARLSPVDNTAPVVISMLSFGLGAGYALVFVSRFREELAAGRKRLEAVRRTAATAGRAIIFSGAAVAASTASLCLVNNPGFRSLTVAATLAGLISVLAAATLLPAVLYLTGSRINALRFLRPAARREHGHRHRKAGWWHRWADAVMRRPWVYAAAALVPLLLLAAPAAGMVTGWPNANQPIEVVVQVNDGTVTDSANLPKLYALAEALRRDPAVAAVVSHVSLQPGWELAQYQDIYIGKPAQLVELPASLSARFQDLSQSTAALRQMRDGLAATARQLPDLGSGAAGLAELRKGLAQTQAGLRGAATQVGAAGETFMQMFQLVGTVDADLGQALQELQAMPPDAQADPHYAAAYRSVAAAYRITNGPPPGADAGPSLSMWMGQTGSNAVDAAKALERMADGLSQTDAALGAVAGGLDQSGTGLTRAAQALNSTVAGLDELIAGLSQASGDMQAVQREIGGVDLKAALAKGDFGLRLAMTAGGDSARQLMLQLVNADRGADVARMIVVPKAGAAAPETRALIRRLRSETLPPLATGLGTVLVGGAPAEQLDVHAQINRALPGVIGLVLLIAFVVLLVLLRSVVLPLVAISMNGLSVLAAYGALVLVFQHGWLAKVLGFTPPGYVSSQSVVLLFAVLFGLSTGYAVLLLSRIKESYDATGKTEEAVAAGLQQTAGTLTGSALIMLVIFGTFALNGMVTVKELGVGLFIAALLDATLIRMILVPAFMGLLGDWNWRVLRQDIAGGSNPYVQN